MTHNISVKKHNCRWNTTYRPNRSALVIFFGFYWLTVQAQIIDSAKTGPQHLVVEQFPPIRAFHIQYENFGKRNFGSKLYHQPFHQGKIENETRLSVDANIPLYLRPRYIVSAALKYSSDNLEFNHTAIKNPDQWCFKPSAQQNFQYFSATQSFTYFSTLFHRPSIYNANIIIDGDQHNVKRVYGFVSTMLEIKHSEYTTISIGVIGFIDPAAVIPAAPILAMLLNFRQSTWWLDCMMPRYILVKRPLFRTGRLSLGSELGGNVFYVNPSKIVPSANYQFNQFELRTGATYEQRISKHFILSIHGAYQHILFAQLAPINKPISDYVYQTKPDGIFFYKLGLSYNIFKQKPKGTQKI